MIKNNEMDTLSGVMNKLRAKGIESEFKLSDNSFKIAGTSNSYEPEQLKIIKTYRFEGDTDPADNAILYLIETNDGKIGYSIDSYGPYSNTSDDEDDEKYDEFIRRLPMEDRDEQQIYGE